MKKLFLLCVLLLSSNVFAYPEECRGRENEFEWELSQFKQRNLKGKTIFSGSSSVRMWKDTHRYFKDLYKNPNGDQNYFNRGFGGSQICHLLIHYKDIFVGKNKDENPERIVIYSGDNDLGNNLTPEKILDHYKILVAMIRESGVDAPIYFITVKPSPRRLYLLDKIKKTGLLMEAELSNLKDVYVVNPYDEFFDEAGKLKDYYLEDQLHLKPIVYEIWASYLESIW